MRVRAAWRLQRLGAMAASCLLTSVAFCDDARATQVLVVETAKTCARVPVDSDVVACEDSAAFEITMSFARSGPKSQRMVYCYPALSVGSWPLDTEPGYRGMRRVRYRGKDRSVAMVGRAKGYEAWVPFGSGSCVTLVRYWSDLDALLAISTSFWRGECDEEKPLSVRACGPQKPRWYGLDR